MWIWVRYETIRWGLSRVNYLSCHNCYRPHGVPPSSWRGGEEYPLPRSRWGGGVPLPRSGQGVSPSFPAGGVSPSQGYPPPHPDLGRRYSPLPGPEKGYPTPGPGKGVPPASTWEGLPPSPPGPGKGIPPPVQVRSKDRGGGGYPNQNSIECTFYAAGGMPLTFMQEDFSVFKRIE